MVTAIRNIEKALGEGIKKPSSSETKNIAVARKSIVAKMSIKIGEKFTKKNLHYARPSTYFKLSDIKKLLGQKSKKDFKAGFSIK